MLVLSRRPGQSILIGKDIEVVVLGSDGVQVRVGIRAPREVTVLRRELLKQVEEENRRASSGTIGVSVESLGAALGQIGGQIGGDFNAKGLGAQPDAAKPLASPEGPEGRRRVGESSVLSNQSSEEPGATRAGLLLAGFTTPGVSPRLSSVASLPPSHHCVCRYRRAAQLCTALSTRLSNARRRLWEVHQHGPPARRRHHGARFGRATSSSSSSRSWASSSPRVCPIPPRPRIRSRATTRPRSRAPRPPRTRATHRRRSPRAHRLVSPAAPRSGRRGLPRLAEHADPRRAAVRRSGPRCWRLFVRASSSRVADLCRFGARHGTARSRATFTDVLRRRRGRCRAARGQGRPASEADRHVRGTLRSRPGRHRQRDNAGVLRRARALDEPVLQESMPGLTVSARGGTRRQTSSGRSPSPRPRSLPCSSIPVRSHRTSHGKPTMSGRRRVRENDRLLHEFQRGACEDRAADAGSLSAIEAQPRDANSNVSRVWRSSSPTCGGRIDPADSAPRRRAEPDARRAVRAAWDHARRRRRRPCRPLLGEHGRL